MKTLIILKGLVKEKKLEWVKNQGLELFFLDYAVIRNLYSAPELLTQKSSVLNFAFSDTVYRRFIEILCNRLSKGCLVVLDIENLSHTVIEYLATIFGYKIFWVVQQIPSDFIKNAKDYIDRSYPIKPRRELDKDVLNFKNTLPSIEKSQMITDYDQVTGYWIERVKKENTRAVKPDAKIIHVSDVHSNINLFEKVELGLDVDLGICYGDYIDGPVVGGSRKMLDVVLSDTRKNIIWLEGNHELRIRRYLGSIFLRGVGKPNVADILVSGITGAFFDTTAKEFERVTPREAMDYIEAMNKKLKLFYVINMPDTTYYCTHSGFRFLEQIGPKYIGNVVYGTRNMDKVDHTFSTTIHKKSNIWSIHAHCKYPSEWKVDKYNGVLNIDPPSENEVVVMTQKLNDFSVCVLKQDE